MVGYVRGLPGGTRSFLSMPCSLRRPTSTRLPAICRLCLLPAGLYTDNYAAYGSRMFYHVWDIPIFCCIGGWVGGWVGAVGGGVGCFSSSAAV